MLRCAHCPSCTRAKGADRVVDPVRKLFLSNLNHHPGCGNKVAIAASLFRPQPPLLSRRGNGLHIVPEALRYTYARMKLSSNRILTTHVGSLPRSEEVVDLLSRREHDQPFDQN